MIRKPGESIVFLRLGAGEAATRLKMFFSTIIKKINLDLFESAKTKRKEK